MYVDGYATKAHTELLEFTCAGRHAQQINTIFEGGQNLVLLCVKTLKLHALHLGQGGGRGLQTLPPETPPL